MNLLNNEPVFSRVNLSDHDDGRDFRSTYFHNLHRRIGPAPKTAPVIDVVAENEKNRHCTERNKGFKPNRRLSVKGAKR